MTAPTRRRPARAGSVRVPPPDWTTGQRAARRRRLVRRVGLAVLALGALAGVAVLVLTSRLLAVREVVVVRTAQPAGVSRVTADEVRSAAAIWPGTALARLPVAAVRRRVARLPAVAGVDGVTVTRRWPHTVVLTVRERLAVAAVSQPDGTWQVLDDTGRPFATESAAPAGLPRLQLAAAGSDDSATRAAIAVVGELPPWLREQVLRVTAPAPDTVTLMLKNRTVIWGAPDAAPARTAGAVTRPPAQPAVAATKAAAVAALLTRPQKTIDVSSPSTIVTR